MRFRGTSQYVYFSLSLALYWCSYHFLLIADVCLPRVCRDGRLWHSCPDCAVDRPCTTPEMSAPKGGSGGSSCCRCWVWKPWYWVRDGEKIINMGTAVYSYFFSHISFTHIHQVSMCLFKPINNKSCLTCVELRTVHCTNHGTQLPSSWNETNSENQCHQPALIQSLMITIMLLIQKILNTNMNWKKYLCELAMKNNWFCDIDFSHMTARAVMKIKHAVPYGSAVRPSPLEYGVVIFLFVITLAVALLTWTPEKVISGWFNPQYWGMIRKMMHSPITFKSVLYAV